MHRPVRQIEVFDISLMAVVTKAMGAFLVLTVLLLPYYTSSPDVDATSAQAHEELEQTRKQMEDLARQLGANPQNADSVRQALQNMQDALNRAGQKIDDLSKQANALDSQLQRARKEAQDAQDAATQAKAAQARAQVAEAEMETQANQAAQARRASQAMAADMEMQANQATQARRTAQASEADLEQRANEATQARRAGQLTQAEGEQTANQFAAVVRNAAFAPKWLLLVSAIPDASCATAPLRMGTTRKAPARLPPGVDLQALGTAADGFLDRSNRLDGWLSMDSGAAGHPPRLIDFTGFWDEQWRDYAFLYADKPLPAACPVNTTVALVDLVNAKVSWFLQPALVIPASGAPTLLTPVTDVGTAHFPTPDPADLAAWEQQKPKTPPANAPPAPPPAPAPR